MTIGMTRLFADDASLSFSSVNRFEIERVLNEDLPKLSAWAKRWLIKFNAQKTEIMLISNTRGYQKVLSLRHFPHSDSTMLHT